MPLLKRILTLVLVLAGGALGGGALSGGAATIGLKPTPRPSARLPFLRRYAQPAPVPNGIERAPASLKKKPAVARGKGPGKNPGKPLTKKGMRGKSPPPHTVSRRTVARPAAKAKPTPAAQKPARALPPAAPVAVVAPKATPPTIEPARQPARTTEPPPAYSMSPTLTPSAPNTTSSTSVLPFHPSTPGRKPPPKTIYLDMTRRYAP